MKNRTLVTVGRVGLWCLLIVWTLYGFWGGWRRTFELIELHSSGRRVNAQVIGYEHMSAGQKMGYVHYAFNEGTRSIDNRFQVPVSTYGDYPIGQLVPVTYLPAEPHIVRLGYVDTGTIVRAAIVPVVFIIAGLLAFGLPLIAIGASLNVSSRPAATGA